MGGPLIIERNSAALSIDRNSASISITRTTGNAITIERDGIPGPPGASGGGGGGGGGSGVTDGDKGDLIISGNGANYNFDPAVVTAFARTWLDDTSAGAVRITLGLGSAATSAVASFEPSGAVVTAVAAHAALPDPHPQYLTPAEASLAYHPLLGYAPENPANRGIAGGYAPLDAGSKIAALYLPAYVDDVVEYPNAASLPAPGETGKIYITLDDDKEFRWSGSAYRLIVASAGSTDAVPEGAVNLYFTNARASAAVAGQLANKVPAGALTASGLTLATARLIGRNSAGAGAPEELNSATVRTMINVADGATANSADAFLLERANHSGTQPVTSISAFVEEVQDVIGAMVVAAGGTYNDPGNAIIFPATGGSAPNIQSFTNSGTWTKPANAKGVDIFCVGGGGGGGSGRRGALATVRCAGGGGSGGTYSTMSLEAALLPATVTCTVGAGGTGGVAVTVDSSNGVNGGAGGNSSFGAFLRAAAGGGGGGGTASTGTGGASATGGMFVSGAGGGASATGAAGSGGGSANAGGSGGGGGGGVTSANAASSGGAGGTEAAGFGTSPGGAAGTAGGGGGTVAARAANDPRPGAGGGGGSSSLAIASGAGGVGQEPGGGGGGGGASVDVMGNSGAGGNGASGRIIIITWF